MTQFENESVPENHAAMVAIHSMYYNFAGICKTLRATPAMAVGLCDQVWSLEEIVRLFAQKASEYMA